MWDCGAGIDCSPCTSVFVCQPGLVQEGFRQFQSQRMHQWDSEVWRLHRSYGRYLKCIQNFTRKRFGIGGFGRRRRSEDSIKAVRGGSEDCELRINRWKPATFNIQQFCVLPTRCICVLCGSEKKQRLFPYPASADWLL